MLKEFAENDLSELDILVVDINGIQLGTYHVICAVGIHFGGPRHVLGLREGATENAEAATALLEDLAARGLDAFTRRALAAPLTERLRSGKRNSLRITRCCHETTACLPAAGRSCGVWYQT